MKVFDTINQEVSEVFEISVADIKGKSRKHEIVCARYASMYIAIHMYQYTLKFVGEAYDRHHTVVRDALAATDILVDQNWMFVYNLYYAWENVKQRSNDLRTTTRI